MMWIIASVPFWLVGGLLAFLGAAGSIAYIRHERAEPGKADTEILWGGVALLVFGGIVLLFAAWVCS